MSSFMSSLSVFVLLKTRRDFQRQANSNVTKGDQRGLEKTLCPKKEAIRGHRAHTFFIQQSN